MSVKTLGEDTLPDYGTPDIDQEQIKARLLETLRRESVNLLAESAEGRLERDRSVALIGYLKYLNQLDEVQKEKLQDLSDEELEKAKNEDT
jgi:hypothetical protein